MYYPLLWCNKQTLHRLRMESSQLDIQLGGQHFAITCVTNLYVPYVFVDRLS
jgi:hypothetical protein